MRKRRRRMTHVRIDGIKILEARLTPYHTFTEPAEPAMSWVELNEVQVNWIYVNLARIQLFFSGNEVQPEFREETVRKFLSEYSFSKQEPVGTSILFHIDSHHHANIPVSYGLDSLYEK